LEPSAFSHRAVFQNFIFRNFSLTASERVHIIRAFCKAKNPVRDCPALQDRAKVVVNVNNANFGRINVVSTPTFPGNPSPYDPRILQLALKLYF